MSEERSSLWEYASCTGDADCPSHVHVHGCFRDFGTCDHPSEHDPAEKMLRLQGFLASRGIGNDETLHIDGCSLRGDHAGACDA